MSSAGARSDGGRLRTAEVVAITAAALAVRLAHLNHPPFLDELYHVLAARSWIADGTFTIGDGAYGRAPMFTRLVGLSMELFGDSLAAARVPSVLAGTAWVAVLFAWLRPRVGAAASWIAGLWLVFDAGAVNLSQMARFYAVQYLLVTIAFMLAYRVGVERPGRRTALALAGGAAAALLLALQFQITTAIAIAAIGCWLAAAWARDAWRLLRTERRARWAAAAAALAATVGGAHMWVSGTAGGLWQTYRRAPGWAAASQHDPWFYAGWFMERYPPLWAFFPVAVLVAFTRHRRMAGFATVVFSVSFVLHSLGGTKAERYFYYAVPLFFVLVALALVALAPPLWNLVSRVLGTSGWPAPVRIVVSSGVLLFCASFAAERMDGVLYGYRMVFPGTPATRPYAEPDWGAAAAALEEAVEEADVVVAGSSPKAIYYLPTTDVGLSATELGETQTGKEFARDERTGLTLISSADAVRELQACTEDGLIVVEDWWWGKPWGVPAETAEHIETSAEPVPLPPSLGLRAYRWTRGAEVSSCELPPALLELLGSTP